MYARFGLNKNGAMAAWRCYGEFSSSNSQLACIDNNGERTNEACLDPIAENKIYCTRTKQIEAIIGPYWNYFDVLIEKKIYNTHAVGEAVGRPDGFEIDFVRNHFPASAAWFFVIILKFVYAYFWNSNLWKKIAWHQKIISF